MWAVLRREVGAAFLGEGERRRGREVREREREGGREGGWEREIIRFKEFPLSDNRAVIKCLTAA